MYRIFSRGQIKRDYFSNRDVGTMQFGRPASDGMRQWLTALGHTSQDIDNLNIIHVAGTKGKGSTCTWTSCFLQAFGAQNNGPKLVAMLNGPPEDDLARCISFNGAPISRDLVVHHVREICDALPQLRRPVDYSLPIVERGPGPTQFLTLLALHSFILAKADATIIECVCGGEYDQTNICQKPVVTAITSIGMDHVRKLGPSIDRIAWHKAGIFKPDAVAITRSQGVRACDDMIKQRATERGCQLNIVDDIDDRLPLDDAKLSVPVQRANASLALAMADAFLAKMRGCEYNPAHPSLSTRDVHHAVEQWHMPGRFETIRQDHTTWYIDFAHNEMSVPIAAEWFAQSLQRATKQADSPDRPQRVLLYLLTPIKRDQEAIFRCFAQPLDSFGTAFDHIIFSSDPKHMPVTLRKDLGPRPGPTAFELPDSERVAAWRADMEAQWTMMETIWRDVMRDSSADFTRYEQLSDAIQHVRELRLQGEQVVFSLGCSILPGINDCPA